VVAAVGPDGGMFRCEGGGERGGEGCGVAPGWRWPFIGARGGMPGDNHGRHRRRNGGRVNGDSSAVKLRFNRGGVMAAV
jgi:hypothetical protein